MLLARLAGVALAGIAFYLEKLTLAASGGRLQSILLITSVTAFFAGLLAEVTWLLWIGVVGIGIGALFALLTLLVESRAQRA